MKEINHFREERDWRKFHKPKDLALSVSIEAAELLENFQWKTSEEAIQENFDNIQDEIADVLIYSYMLASDLNLDIDTLILNKLEKNKRKYPLEKSKGSKQKYTEYN
ncbi:nucleotide pyrophosphohydrolase [Listeria fleischmannii]|uniref:Nucleotide pyrophosphohydrolase n=1 Tax=Listeria fleischmannii TaxID=1069827 RepID=A0A841YHK9_9LIST|nr:nucleotide pyrophosphohydrolase [Listeria fleischmannii]MBC1399769.1 nucleotide pyrophosphohydrolase [Listeria fleischmannii]MBC1419653.1 nucleotide pyrophosphohydrolase [Listeria fleischmannii]MBC1428077.1 nucleotide pyrophosphohydrolase [Listeria fleischmannii]